MSGKYIHPNNCHPNPKGKAQGDMSKGKKSGPYPMPPMNRSNAGEQKVAGPKHYRKV